MQKTPFEFRTGRTYNGPQVLRIVPVVVSSFDENGMADARFDVADDSRGMRFEVTTIIWDTDGLDNIGYAIMQAYDAGRYDLI